MQRLSQFGRWLLLGATDNSPYTTAGQGLNTSGISVIAQNDDRFTAILDNFFPGVTNWSTFSIAKQHIHLLENMSGLLAKAYSIEMTSSDSSGVEVVQYRHFVLKHSMPKALAHASQPGGHRLLSPLFNVDPAEYAASNIRLASIPASLYPRGKTVTSFRLDAAILADGTVIGPDRGRLVRHYHAVRNAEHDEGVSLRLLLTKLPSHGDIVAHLQTNAEKGRTVKPTNAQSIYQRARAYEALALRSMYLSQGIAAITGAANRMSAYPRDVLRLPSAG